MAEVTSKRSHAEGDIEKVTSGRKDLFYEYHIQKVTSTQNMTDLKKVTPGQKHDACAEGHIQKVTSGRKVSDMRQLTLI